MKIPFEKKEGFAFLSDDTSTLDTHTLFLKTEQNRHYFERLETKPVSITPLELIWIVGFRDNESCWRNRNQW